ncbi:MAG: peptide chain release factor N(5)-glutamine methyltransferase [Planctomycetota bacterium]
MSQAPSNDPTWTIGKLLEWTTRHFQQKGIDNARLDAEVLLARVLACRRIDLYAMYDVEVSPEDRTRFRDWVRQRTGGCPVAYLVGQREFYSLTFDVTPAVLIPRPETEHLIACALDFARKESLARFLDLGSGSGAIAVTLAHELTSIRGVAIDVSPEAIVVAKANATRHAVADRLTFLVSDLFSRLEESEGPFDLIASNPPYVSDEEYASLPATVRDFEPRLALAGGAGGIEIIRRIIEEAPRWLRLGGKLLMEIGERQESAVRVLLESNSHFSGVAVHRDYSGKPRVMEARRT